MAKKSGSNFFLEKGEKIAVAVGAVGLAAFLVWGVMSFLAADDPKELAGAIKRKSTQVTTEVNGSKVRAEDLPKAILMPPSFPAVAPKEFPVVASTFEPIAQPDMLRENPRVLGIYQWQVDVVRGPMRALDIQRNAKGEIEVGVLITKKIAEKDKFNFEKNMKDLFQNRPRFNPRQPVAPPQPQPPGPPGPNPAVRPGVGPNGDPYGAGPNSLGGDFRRSEDKAVEYMSPEEAAKKGLPLAETVVPMRMVVVTAAFPIKQQLAEIQRALRLQSLAHAALEATGGTAVGVVGGVQPAPAPIPVPPVGGKVTGPTGGQAPVFDGFDVERRVIPPGTSPDEIDKLPWTPYDHYGEYKERIAARMIDSLPDQGYLPYFTRPEQKMTAPLPQMIPGLSSYPPIRLASVVDAIAKLREAQKPVLTPSQLEKRLGKLGEDENPFAPRGQGTTNGLIGNFPNAPQPPVDPKKPDGKVDPNAQGLPDADVMMLRFLDPDTESGHAYQYRVRVRMKNPNYGKEDKVREKSEAKKALLEGPWVAIPDIAVMPPEAFLYAYDPEEYLKAAKTTVEEVLSNVAVPKRAAALYNMNSLLHHREVSSGKQAVVQFQTWMPQVRASADKSEPVGTWVMAEIPVAVGEYIGKRTLVRLPLWSSSVGNYVLRELGGGIKIAGIPADSQPKGWAVNFKTKSLLLDFEGGLLNEKVGNKTVKDAAATDLLILRSDGKLMLKNSARDMADEGRTQRNADWDKWIADVKDRKEVVPGTGTNPNPIKRD